MALRGYLDETSRVDLMRRDGVRRDPESVLRVIRSLARNVSTQASSRSIAADVRGPEGRMDHHTVLDYTTALSRLFVVEQLPAWSPALRSRSVLRQAMTHHLVDPSLASAALEASPARLVSDVRTLGLLFESLVVRDLRVFAQASDSSVYHYRDNTGLEVDAIVQRRDGTWAAFEVKLGAAAIDAAAAALLRLAERVDRERHGPPAVLAVITGWGFAYQRADGVAVIPIGVLGA
jgi:predicted AAA+ superfamily ATPase